MAATLLVLAIVIGVVLANLKRIVLARLRASFPGLHVSVARVSLKSLSHLRITGLRLSGERGEKGSFLLMPRVDVRYRLDPLKGFLLTSIDLARVEAALRPGLGALFASVARSARKTAREATFPPGPSIGRISLADSRLDFNTPDFQFRSSIQAVADSSSSGILLDNTDFSLVLRNVFMSLPPFKLQDVDSELSTFIARDPTGSGIQILRGRFSIPGIVETDFRGDLSLEKSALAAQCRLDVQSLDLEEAAAHLKESFPEIADSRIEGVASGRLQFHYRSRSPRQLSLSGDISLRGGRALLPIPEPLIAEGVEADVPFRFSVLDGRTSVAVGSDERHLAGATVAATRILYEEQELASDVLASFELQPGQENTQTLKSLKAFFHSHGGTANARVSGSLRSDGADLQGEVNAQNVWLEEVFRHLRIKKYGVWGRASGKARFACTAGPKAALAVKGELSLRVPNATVSLKKPLNVWGLKVSGPFEYSAAATVQPFGVGTNDTYPLGATIAADQIGYGERAAQDRTTVPQWSVSGFWATASRVGQATELSVRSCRVYDGELTGTVRASLQKKDLPFRGDLSLRNLDLERLLKGLGVEREKFYINGLAQGQVTVSGENSKWDEIRAEFSAIPPKGIPRVEDVGAFFNSLEKSKKKYSPTEWKAFVQRMNEGGGILQVQNVDELLDSLPDEARNAVLEARKRAFTDQQWARFREALKDFRYRLVIVNVSLRPLQTAPGKGYRAEAELRLAGMGAKEPFDEFDISIRPITYDVIYLREESSPPGRVTRPAVQTK